MIDTGIRHHGHEATALDPAPLADPWWLDDDVDEGPPLPFWDQVYRRRVRRTYEQVRNAWERFDELCLQRPVLSELDNDARAEARRSLHQALVRLQRLSSPH
jgi:hypothetical protein